MKENHKMKQDLLRNSKWGGDFVIFYDDHLLHPNIAVSFSIQDSHDVQLKNLEGMLLSTHHVPC